MGILGVLSVALADALLFNKVIPQIYVEASVTASIVVWNAALAVTAFILSIHSPQNKGRKTQIYS